MVQSLIVREDNLELDIQKVPAKFIVEAFEFLSLPISHELQIILEESEIRRAYHTLYTDNWLYRGNLTLGFSNLIKFSKLFIPYNPFSFDPSIEMKEFILIGIAPWGRKIYFLKKNLLTLTEKSIPFW